MIDHQASSEKRIAKLSGAAESSKRNCRCKRVPLVLRLRNQCFCVCECVFAFVYVWLCSSFALPRRYSCKLIRVRKSAELVAKTAKQKFSYYHVKALGRGSTQTVGNGKSMSKQTSWRKLRKQDDSESRVRFVFKLIIITNWFGATVQVRSHYEFFNN